MKEILREYHANYAKICTAQGEDGMCRVSPHLVEAMFPTPASAVSLGGAAAVAATEPVCIAAQ